MYFSEIEKRKYNIQDIVKKVFELPVRPILLNIKHFHIIFHNLIFPNKKSDKILNDANMAEKNYYLAITETDFYSTKLEDYKESKYAKLYTALGDINLINIITDNRDLDTIHNYYSDKEKLTGLR